MPNYIIGNLDCVIHMAYDYRRRAYRSEAKQAEWRDRELRALQMLSQRGSKSDDSMYYTLFLLGEVQTALDQLDEAAGTYGLFLERYPDHPSAATVKTELDRLGERKRSQ